MLHNKVQIIVTYVSFLFFFSKDLTSDLREATS